MSSPNSLLDWTEARQNHAIDCFVLMPAPRCACRRQAGQTGTAGGADLVAVRLRIGGQPQGARLRAEPGRTRRAGAARARGRAWYSAPSYPAVPDADQRESRALHPDLAGRMGVSPSVRNNAERLRALPRWVR